MSDWQPSPCHGHPPIGKALSPSIWTHLCTSIHDIYTTPQMYTVLLYGATNQIIFQTALFCTTPPPPSQKKKSVTKLLPHL